MHLPEQLDRELVIDNIIIETAELSLVYSEPDTFSYMVERWSKRRNYIWTELFKTLLYKYDPIANYDRWEESVHREDSESSTQSRGSFTTNGTNEDNRNGTFKTGMEEGGKDGYENTSESAVSENSSTDTNGTHKTDTVVNGSDNMDADYNTSRTPNLTQTTTGKADTTGNDTTVHSNYAFNNTLPAKAWEEDKTAASHTEDESTIKNTGTETTSGLSHTKETTSSTTNENGSESGHSETKSTKNEKGSEKHNGIWEGHRNETGNDSDIVKGSREESGKDRKDTSGQEIHFAADKSHMYGNIGVTSTQDLIIKQRQTVEFDVIGYIVKDFKKQFCIGIY